MIIAEQNISLLEGHVTRMLGIHAGRIKGGMEAVQVASAVSPH
jgi:hypothetical protein